MVYTAYICLEYQLLSHIIFYVSHVHTHCYYCCFIYRHVSHNSSAVDMTRSDSSEPSSTRYSSPYTATHTQSNTPSKQQQQQQYDSPSKHTTTTPTTTTTTTGDRNANLGLLLHEKFDYERLKLDFKLKEADNRFLQEELENKDRMLAMLTEGLKEVGTVVCIVYST